MAESQPFPLRGALENVERLMKRRRQHVLWRQRRHHHLRHRSLSDGDAGAGGSKILLIEPKRVGDAGHPFVSLRGSTRPVEECGPALWKHVGDRDGVGPITGPERLAVTLAEPDE